jgi:hypothetical protein
MAANRLLDQREDDRRAGGDHDNLRGGCGLNPWQADGLGRAVGEAHRGYSSFISARGCWTGHLFQSRFASVAMDESDPIPAVCYVSLNPVRARLVAHAEDWPLVECQSTYKWRR